MYVVGADSLEAPPIYLYSISAKGSINWRYRLGVKAYDFGNGFTNVEEIRPSVDRAGNIFVLGDDAAYSITGEGTKRWVVTRRSAQTESNMALGEDGTSVFGSGGLGRVLAFGPDGSQRWSFSTHQSTVGTPAISTDGTIYEGTGSTGGTSEFSGLYALHTDGSIRWKFSIKNGTSGSPSIGPKGRIYVGGNVLGGGGPSLYALNPDGSLYWEFHNEGDFASVDRPIVTSSGDIVALFNTAGKLVTIGPDGKERWEYYVGALNSIASPAISPDGETIYVATGASGRLLAIGADVGPEYTAAPGATSTRSVSLRSVGVPEPKTQRSVSARNHVTNPSFEDAFAGYTMQYNTAPTAHFEIVATTSHSGSHSLEITNRNPMSPNVYKTFYQKVNGLLPNTDYRISFWTRAQNAMSGGTLDLIVDGDAGWNVRLHSARGTHGWQEVGGVYNTREKTYFFLRFITEDTGTVYLDDVTVSRAN